MASSADNTSASEASLKQQVDRILEEEDGATRGASGSGSGDFSLSAARSGTRDLTADVGAPLFTGAGGGAGVTGDDLFEPEENFVYRSVPEGATLAAASSTTRSLSSALQVAPQSYKSLAAAADPALSSISLHAAKRAAASGPISAIASKSLSADLVGAQPPAVPSPYAWSPYNWVVSGSAGHLVADSIAQALVAAGVSLEAAKPFQYNCVAVVGNSPVRFVVRIFSAGARNSQHLELQRMSGSCMAWDTLYRRITAAMPATVQPPVAAAADPFVATASADMAAASAEGGLLDDSDDEEGSDDVGALPPPPSAFGGVPEPSVPRLHAGDVEPLLAMLNSPIVTLQRDAAEAFASLSEKAANASVLVDDGVVGAMAALIAYNMDWAVVRAAATCVANVAAAMFAADSEATSKQRGETAQVLTPCIKTMAEEIAHPKRNPLTSRLTKEAVVRDLLRRECINALASISLHKACAETLVTYKLGAALQSSRSLPGAEGESARTCLANIDAAIA